MAKVKHKTISGKRYTLLGRWFDRRLARKAANEHRTRGYNARVVPREVTNLREDKKPITMWHVWILWIRKAGRKR